MSVLCFFEVFAEIREPVRNAVLNWLSETVLNWLFLEELGRPGWFRTLPVFLLAACVVLAAARAVYPCLP